MNEEEKTLIEHIVLAYKDDEEDTHMVNVQGTFIQNKDIAYLLEKQQKEIDKCEYYQDHADLFFEENKKQQKEIEALKIIHEAYKEQIEDIEKRYISKDKIRELKEKIHQTLDVNGITRAYQLIIDDYFEKLLGE